MAGEDDYQTKYMGGADILYQSKAKAPAGFTLLLFLPVFLQALIFSIVALAKVPPHGHQQPMPVWAYPLMLLPTLLFCGGLWTLFSVLRCTVTSAHVHIQYGLFGPKIPLEKIEMCEAVHYDWKQYGGFGIRKSFDGSTMYNMMGDQGRAVRIRWKKENGAEATTLVSAQDPEAFVRAVMKAKGVATSPAKKRVAADDKIDQDLDREFAGEAEAEAEAEAARSSEEKAKK